MPPMIMKQKEAALHTIRNPEDRLRKAFEQFVVPQMPTFIDAIEGRAGQAANVDANVRLMICKGMAHQLGHIKHRMESDEMQQFVGAGESALQVTTDFSSFLTRQLHMAMTIYPRMLAPRLCSVQPLTQISEYVFFLRDQDETGRNLDVLSTFNKNYAADPGEGVQIKAVKRTMDSALVTAAYRKLMYEQTHETDVKMRTQFNMDPMALADPLLINELAWEVDRDVIDQLVAFASWNSYYDPEPSTYAAMTMTDRKEYEQNFVKIAVQAAATNIEKTCYRSPNWAIGGSSVIAYLKRLPMWSSTPLAAWAGDQALTGGSVIASGQIAGMQVLHDPQLSANLLMIGYVEQASPYHAGFIYAPFGAASHATAVFENPQNLKSAKARCVAHATYGVKSTQFAKIWLQRS